MKPQFTISKNVIILILLAVIGAMGTYIGGGGKRAKASSQEEVNSGVVFVPVPEAGDATQIAQGIALKGINLENWVSSLSIDKAVRLCEVMDDQTKTGKLDALVGPYLFAINEYSALTVFFLVSA